MAIMLCHILILMEHAIIGKISESDTTSTGQVDYACLAAIICIMLAIHCYFIAFYVQTVSYSYKTLYT